MKPYYDHAGITIYHGDCREILPQLPKGWCSTCVVELADEMILAIHLAAGHEIGPYFDLLLTDPPYGIGEHGGACRTRGNPGYAKHENLGWDTERPERQIFDLALSFSSEAVIWGGNYFSDYLPPKMGWLYWEKLMGGDFSDGELAWTTRDGALRQFTKCPKGMNKLHPCEKPIELLHWCLGFFPNTSRVLDSFAGSGSSLVSAKNLGKSAIGIEIEEKYCEIAAKRLSQEVFDFS